MARRILLSAAFVAAALVPMVLISCSDDSANGGTGGGGGSGGSGGSGGGAGSGGAPSNDGGTSDANTPDAPSTADSGGKGGSDGGVTPDAGGTLPDGAVPPSGMQVVSGDVTLAGVTSDNFAIYTDNTASTLNAVSLAGGAPVSLGSSSDRVVVSGSVVLTWSGGARVGTLSAWTSAKGQHVLGMSSYASATAVAVSPNGARVLYFDGVDTGRTAGNLFIASTDGTGQTQLAPSVALNNTSCAPVLAFGGNSAAAAAFCGATSAPDGGIADAGTADAANPEGGSAPTATVQSYSGASWAVTTIATGVQPQVAIAPTGTTVLVNAPAGLLAYPIGGGTATTIDAAGGVGTFTNDGLSVIYTTPANALKRSTVASPSPITLAPSGIAGLRAKSGDDKWVLGYSTIDTRNDVSDLYLASAATAGTPTTLSSAATAGLFTSDGFTTDSSHAIYYTDIANGLGTFYSVATSGGAPVSLSTTAWIHHAAVGSKVAFSDNYDQATNTADIRVADTAQTAPPKVVVSLADADFFVAGTKDKVVYAWTYLAGSMSGLWVAPIP